MKDKVLVVVDMQNDFINGSLGTSEAQQIVENVAKKIRKHDGYILVTLDTHQDNYFETLEGKLLPVMHCLKYTDGWNLNEDIRAALFGKEYYMIEKPTFGTSQIGSSIKMWAAKNLGSFDFEIEIVGLCSDICVISNALLLRSEYPNVPITVYEDCCAGVTPQKHEAAMSVMESCQITVKRSEQSDKG